MPSLLEGVPNVIAEADASFPNPLLPKSFTSNKVKNALASIIWLFYIIILVFSNLDSWLYSSLYFDGFICFYLIWLYWVFDTLKTWFWNY